MNNSIESFLSLTLSCVYVKVRYREQKIRDITSDNPVKKVSEPTNENENVSVSEIINN